MSQAAGDQPLYEQILRDPLLLEVAAVAAGLLLLGLGLAWIRRFARDVRRRAAFQNYLLGVDRVLKGDWAGAREPLEAVLKEDPENVDARAALGDALRELGLPADAERLHLEAVEAFGDRRPGTRLSLARDHLAQGQPDRACARLEEVLTEVPGDPLALELMAQGQEELGHFPQAVRALKTRLAQLEGDLSAGPQRERLRFRIGFLLAEEGARQELAGEAGGALACYREALTWAPGLTRARAGTVRCVALLGRPGEATAALEETLRDLECRLQEPDFLVLPIPGETGDLPVSPAGRLALPGGASLALPGEGAALPAVPVAQAGLLPRLLEREALYQCEACGRAAAAWQEACPACGKPGGLRPTHPVFMAEIAGVDELMDELEENEAHLRRLVGALYHGENDAVERILDTGARALPVLYAELHSREEVEPLLRVLRAAGPGVLPALREEHRRRQERPRGFLEGLLALGRRRRPLCLVARAFGGCPEAEAFFLGLLESEDVEERRAVLDYFIAAARPAAFEQLQGFARVEVLNHLSRIPPGDLLPLLLRLERDDLLLDWVLTDPALAIDDILVEAFARARSREALAELLRRRGFRPDVERALHALLCHETARAQALEVLAGFGPEALPWRVPVVLDPDTPAEVREALAGLVAAAGGEAVAEILLRCPGPKPSPVDEAALDLVARIGPPALPALARIYRDEGGLLARFPLLRKRSQRRRELALRAAARIPGAEAGALLADLAREEQETALKELAESLRTNREAAP